MKSSIILKVDTAALERAILDGGKLSAVAAEHGVSETWLCHYFSSRGIAHTWVTGEERRLLAELRAGRAMIVRADCAPAAARLAQRMEAALDEYTRGLSSGS